MPALATQQLTISVQDFNASSPGDTPYNLANIADFNSLIAQSQKFSTPVFALSDQQIEQSGYILDTMKKSRDDFAKTFNGLANSIEIIAGDLARALRIVKVVANDADFKLSSIVLLGTALV